MKVKMYVKNHCPYCIKVERYLKKNNIPYEKTDITFKPSLYSEIKKQTGHQTVPQVFIDDKFIGGSTEFFAYIKAKN